MAKGFLGVKAAEQALKNGDEEALLVYRLTMPRVTTKQAKEQRERLAKQFDKSQNNVTMTP